jgi:hypothetical protein
MIGTNLRRNYPSEGRRLVRFALGRFRIEKLMSMNRFTIGKRFKLEYLLFFQNTFNFLSVNSIKT